MTLNRKDTKPIMVSNLQIGGNDKVVLQSMTTTKTKDVKATVSQINRLEEAGCQLVRVACPTIEDAQAIKEIKKLVSVPLSADIHFDYKIALEAINAGVDKIRLNPGNIGSDERIIKVINACKEKKIPIRIGVNSGSLEKHIMEKYGFPTADGMIESAKYHVELLEKHGFDQIIISLKASNMQMAVEAYEKASEIFPYPLHLGITEAGTAFGGTIKSSIGLGIILNKGIGSTMRVSLSDDPVIEIEVGREILKNFGLISNMPTLISCPTCGRINVDMIPLANDLEDFLKTIKAPLKVALLGCAVNGPGEAKEADIGIACGNNEGLLIKGGEFIRKYPADTMMDELKKEIIILEKDYLQKHK